ncbi:hypothetical protein D3C75_663150 [compost metagenome]
MGIADGADGDAEQLELGAHVRPLEAAVAAEQMVDGDLGHLVARCHQPEEAALPGGALADGIDVGIRGEAVIVDQHTAALCYGQFAITAQGVLRAYAGGEDHHIHLKGGAVGEGEAVFGLLAAVHQDLAGALAGVHLHAHGFNLAAQQLAALTVELLGHQHRGKLHHVGLETQCLEGAGGFQAEQAAPNDNTTLAALGGAADGFQILDGAIDEALVVLAALDGRHPGVGAGGQHQLVIADHSALVGVHFAVGPVDFFHRFAEQQADAVLLVETGFDEGEIFAGVVGEVGGEMDTIVGGTRFCTEDGDLEPVRIGSLDQLFDEAVPHHAVADDGQPDFAHDCL